jgi:hypothetical protein
MKIRMNNGTEESKPITNGGVDKGVVSLELYRVDIEKLAAKTPSQIKTWLVDIHKKFHKPF